MMWLKVGVLYILLIIVAAQEIGDTCVPNNEISDGICTVVTDCEPAINDLRTKRRHYFQRCGFRGKLEVVCCPPTTSKFGSNERSTTDAQKIADRECEKIRAERIEPLNLNILDGEMASVGEFQHMVALGFDRGDGFKFDCGGSVLSSTYVLTAAHCVDTADRIEPTIIRTGVIDIGENQYDEETDVGIVQTILHPNYSRLRKYHDLALLKLNKTLSFSSTLNAICLETSTEDPTLPLYITGWGKISNSRDQRSKILLKANVTINDISTCAPNYEGWRKLPDGISRDQLCAGDPNGRKDSCQGDSGGPLQSIDGSGQYKLVGVTSFGRGCGSTVPGVYVRVARYLDWIVPIVYPQ